MVVYGYSRNGRRRNRNNGSGCNGHSEIVIERKKWWYF